MSTQDHAGAGRMPASYIPHGAGPCFFMDWNPPDTWDGMAGFLRGIAATLPARRGRHPGRPAGAAGDAPGRKAA